MQTSIYPGNQTHPSPAFPDHSEKAEAKRQLGIDPDSMHLLVFCPGCEANALSELLSMIYIGDDMDSEISIICWENVEQSRYLEKAIGHIETFHLYGVPDDMSMMFYSADLILAQANDGIAMEAARLHLPLVLVDEQNMSGNCRRLMERGCAVSSRDSAELAEACVELLRNRQRRKQMEMNYGLL